MGETLAKVPLVALFFKRNLFLDKTSLQPYYR